MINVNRVFEKQIENGFLEEFPLIKEMLNELRSPSTYHDVKVGYIGEKQCKELEEDYTGGIQEIGQMTRDGFPRHPGWYLVIQKNQNEHYRFYGFSDMVSTSINESNSWLADRFTYNSWVEEPNGLINCVHFNREDAYKYERDLYKSIIDNNLPAFIVEKFRGISRAERINPNQVIDGVSGKEEVYKLTYDNGFHTIVTFDDIKRKTPYHLVFANKKDERKGGLPVYYRKTLNLKPQSYENVKTFFIQDSEKYNVRKLFHSWENSIKPCNRYNVENKIGNILDEDCLWVKEGKIKDGPIEEYTFHEEYLRDRELAYKDQNPKKSFTILNVSEPYLKDKKTEYIEITIKFFDSDESAGYEKDKDYVIVPRIVEDKELSSDFIEKRVITFDLIEREKYENKTIKGIYASYYPDKGNRIIIPLFEYEEPKRMDINRH